MKTCYHSLALQPLSPCSDLRLDCADGEQRLWNAAGDERCAVQRLRQPAGARGRGGAARPGTATSAAAGGTSAPVAADEAAAAVAAWVAASPDTVAQLRRRVEELLA